MPKHDLLSTYEIIKIMTGLSDEQIDNLLKNNTFSYFEYNIKDHLGNVWVIIKDDGTTLQSSDYLLFGTFHNKPTISYQVQLKTGFSA